MISAIPYRSLMLATALCAGPNLVPAAEPPGTDGATQREYVAYLGLDVKVHDRGQDCPVVSYDEPKLSILHGSEQVRIASRDAQFALSMEPKLGRRDLTLSDLRAQAVIDPRNDPVRRGMQQQQLMDDVQTQNQELAAAKAGQADSYAIGLATASHVPFSLVTPEMVAAAQADANSALQDVGNAYAMPMFQSHTPGQVTTGEGAATDAFEVTFRLSAQEELRDTFGLLRMVVRDPANPQQPLSVLKFFPLRHVGPASRKISILQTGLPAGFAVDSYTVHIYSEGEELPTNLSANRMDLSIDEAQQFLILRHCQLNRTASIPAEIIPDLIPPEVRTWLAAIHTDATVDLEIDRDGRMTKVDAIRANADLSVAEVENKLREVRFFPALLKGSPADSKGTFALSEFSR